MAANRIEEAKKSDAGRKGEAEAPAAAAPAPSGGIKPWLPLILNIVLMPAIAFALTQFVLVPKLKGKTADAPETESAEGNTTEKNGKPKITAALSSKVLVNVAGTMGTRYLMATITLVGSNPQLKELVDKNDAELRDAAASALSTKTINDLEKPGSRNLIRTELISLFNNVLGNGVVTEIYLTEFAIQ